MGNSYAEKPGLSSGAVTASQPIIFWAAVQSSYLSPSPPIDFEDFDDGGRSNFKTKFESR